MKSAIGTFHVLVGGLSDGTWMASKVVTLPDGTPDVVTLGGETSLGRFSDLAVLTRHRVMAAMGRQVEAGRLSEGYFTNIPAKHLVSAHAHVRGLDGFLQRRLRWIKDDRQRDQHAALLAQVKAIMDAEQASN